MTEEHQLTGHGGSVLCARVFRGHLLFSGSVDGTVKVSILSWTMTVWPSACGGPLQALAQRPNPMHPHPWVLIVRSQIIASCWADTQSTGSATAAGVGPGDVQVRWHPAAGGKAGRAPGAGSWAAVCCFGASL